MLPCSRIMDGFGWRSSAGALRPARCSLPAALVPAAWVLGLLGCQPTAVVYAYGGTGILQASGAPSNELGHQDVLVMSCPPVYQDASFAVMNIGPGCAFWGRWLETAFVADPGGTCELRLPDRTINMRVLDVIFRFGRLYGHRYAVPDDAFVEIFVGGLVANASGKVDHELYTFRGAVTAERAADKDCRQARSLAHATTESNPSYTPASSKASDWER
jgi:hypothetical protein